MNWRSGLRRKNPALRLDRRLWLSVGLFAGLIVFQQFLIQPALIRLMSDAPAINIAGRQRMLSQKIAKAALANMDTTDAAIADASRKELETTLHEWRSAHESLKSGVHVTLLGRTNSLAIQRGFRELDPHFQVMARSAEELLKQSDPATNRVALQSILDHESKYLEQMHALVGLYENEARRHVRNLQNLSLTIMVVILGAQLAIQIGVMQPALRFFGVEFERISANYEVLVESMTDGLVVFDNCGRVTFANQRFHDMIGPSTRALAGQPAASFICDTDRVQFEMLLTGTNEITGPVDLSLRNAAGSIVETMVSPRRMCAAAENLEGLLLVVTDVTARRASERRSRQLQTELAHADRLKSMGAMAAALAHEINQPLGAISNYAEGCLARLTAGPVTDPSDLTIPLRGILRASHRGAEIVRRTREFARRRPHQVNDESINDLIHEVEELCRPEARRRGVVITSQLLKDDVTIPVDGIQIQQVLTNLIQNAFHAIERNSGSQRKITLFAALTADNEVEVSVADSGLGLPISDSNSWFEPFVTTEENGTGLGLAISKGIVETQGGRIWCEANPDGGAIFRFTLPLMAPSDSHAEYIRVAGEAYVG